MYLPIHLMFNSLYLKEKGYISGNTNENGMRDILSRLCMAGCLTLLFCFAAVAQEQPENVVIKRHTIMGQFAPDLVLSAEERQQLKWERRETVSYREAVIDSLPVSRRIKRKLLKELYYTPFTETYDEVLHELETREEPEGTHPQ